MLSHAFCAGRALRVTFPSPSSRILLFDASPGVGAPRRFCSRAATALKNSKDLPSIVEVDYHDLKQLNPRALEQLREAFVGNKAYGAVAVINIPGYGDKLTKAFRAGIDFALSDSEGRKRAAAVNNTYPGWSGTPGEETHPLQSSMLFNAKQEIPGGKPNPYFGINNFPSKEYRDTWVNLVTPMHDAALDVLRGCDTIIEEDLARKGLKWSAEGRSLYQLGLQGPALASRFICYDSGFTREDTMLQRKDEPNQVLESRPTSPDVLMVPQKSAGHSSDGLASMRTHSTPVKSAGHAADGLASMRTHSTPVKSAGHACDGLASMRTHSTPVKSAGHSGDGLASMRTHSTPVKSAGHSTEGVAALRGHSPSSVSSSQTVRAHATQTMSTTSGSSEPMFFDPSIDQPVQVETEAAPKEDAGEYWLPWHIDSNFVTVLHKEMYADEKTTEFVPEPEGAGLLIMNADGDVTKLRTRDDAVILQMGAFAQIYAGGYVNAARHAVVSPRPPGVARFNFCNFWYVPWETACTAPAGTEHAAVSTGWNAMMDESYLNITQKQGFAAFREFMTAPEARVQFADSVQFKELAELFPLPGKRLNLASNSSEIVVDVLTDVRCPFSFVSQLNLDAALKNLGLDQNVTIRYHPVFLNPNVPKEGENLDDYLLREYGYTKEYAHSESYPLRVMGLEAGVELNPSRRVVNTFDAFVLIEAASEAGRQHEVVKALSQRYFEGAEDISDVAVLCAAAEDAGLSGQDAKGWISDPARRARVLAEFQTVSSRIGEVPHFLVRERISGNGVEVGGKKSVEEWESALESVLEKSSVIGKTIPGPYGQDVRLSECVPYSPISMALSAQHGFEPGSWPFDASDFSRNDESPDDYMYTEPRLVNHLDDTSLARLTEAYRSVFSMVPQGFSVLDMCSSWNSHYPQELLEGARVAVHGLNQRELWANGQATERHVQDVNADAKLPWEDNSFDFVTMALSIQYMTDPRAIFSEMHRVLKPGGMVVIAHSHRVFIDKAVKAFAQETYDGEGHTHTICRYFQHGPQGGWEKLSTADVSPRHGDPMWLVTAVKA
eukprot:CAMPEP_0177178744 /NCGR_PEP_ID=MMETSP0367-20130122/14488_1 /TAXON_ID=447022 ORGANISM="Scrippsiella hangoei-like, Strain SHHI-4" /NCGR_SAMPLE_ID=MMETSP0367 /ASSEMBLY_ACC=CAM_ASM_000362 /LENGTH=1061 /DNA_ID=CAMNT_0018625415 /DNA_START=100 /DNA_END=3285 /DNA_ORIENTATION=-